ncbi:MAG: DUF6776 family protein, partial [Pseudomonadales bacterium]
MFACTVLFSLGLLLLGGYWVYSIGLADGKQAIAQYASMTKELAGLERELRSEQQRAVSAEKSAEIDRMAAEEVRETLLEYRNELAELQSNITFYRRLMAPDELDKGLGLHAFGLSYNEKTASYHYSGLVTQAGDQNKLLKGK